MSQPNPSRIGLSLEPLDTLFFRDGRPFEAATQAASGLPMPQTFAGALRTWLLRKADCNFDRLGEAMEKGQSFQDALIDGQGPEVAAISQLRFRGPWFAQALPPQGGTTNENQAAGTPESSIVPLVPVPANLHKIKQTGEIVRLDPLNNPVLPGWNRKDNRHLLPLWWKGNEPTKRLEGYLTLDGLKKVLEGAVPDQADTRQAHDLFDFDRRVGIGVDPDGLTADEGQIYAVSLLALKRKVSLYAEVEGPEEALKLLPDQGTSVPIPLGGEGRRVALKRAVPVSWPEASPQEGRTLLLLTTPAFFDARSPKDSASAGFSRSSVIAAAVPGYEAVSGWDLAKRGPKPTRFAAKAGSVYFLDRPLTTHHSPLTSMPSLCDGEDAALGWGAFVIGGWNYA